MKRASPIDMVNLEILNLRLHQVAGNLGSPVEGNLWYDSTAHKPKVRNNGSNLIVWTDGADVPAGNIPNTALTTNPLARANHTGTQLAASVSDFDTQVRTSRLDQMAAPTASVVLNSQKITGLLDPTGAQDAATKNYVDNAIAGLSWKDEVRVATTANGTLATAFANGQTIDGITLATGDRILVKNQTTQTENGIYTVPAAGAPTRATDSDTGAELLGAAVYVSVGTTNATTRWVNTNSGPITLGSTNITFTSFGGGATYTAGNGINLAGNVFSVVADTGISVSGTGVAVNHAVVPMLFTGNIGDGSTTSIVVTHNLGTRAVIVKVFLATGTFEEIEVDCQHTSTTTVTLIFAVAPTTNQYTVVVHG